jgi:hypothetical protein
LQDSGLILVRFYSKSSDQSTSIAVEKDNSRCGSLVEQNGEGDGCETNIAAGGFL